MSVSLNKKTQRTARCFFCQAKADVREEVWNGSLCSAGVAVRFQTNASKIALSYETIWTYSPHGGPVRTKRLCAYFHINILTKLR
jgi:hypothetical protein